VKPVLGTVEEVAQEFLAFMREHYDTHYGDSNGTRGSTETGLYSWSAGTTGRPSAVAVVRVSVEENHVARLYGAGRFRLWHGKVNPTPVERLIRGYDSALRASIEDQITLAMQSARKSIGRCGSIHASASA